VLRSELRRLTDRVGGRLRMHGWVASTISIKLRFADFTTLSRSQTLTEPTSVGQRIGDAASLLFDSVERPLPVRLVGVRGEKLRAAQDEIMTLWDDDAEWKRVEGALDDAAARFGKGSVTRATLLGRARGGSALPSHPRAPTGE
jgi:DNA polymerase-4